MLLCTPLTPWYISDSQMELWKWELVIKGTSCSHFYPICLKGHGIILEAMTTPRILASQLILSAGFCILAMNCYLYKIPSKSINYVNSSNKKWNGYEWCSPGWTHCKHRAEARSTFQGIGQGSMEGREEHLGVAWRKHIMYVVTPGNRQDWGLQAQMEFTLSSSHL